MGKRDANANHHETVEGACRDDLELNFEDFTRMIREEWKLKSYYQTDIAQVSHLVAFKEVAFIINPVAYDFENTYLRDLKSLAQSWPESS